MLRLAKIITVFLLLISLSLLKPSTTQAFLFFNSQEIQEYCEMRKGNQVNLETWYSGRCGGSFGERLGFADMVKLDIDTKYFGWMHGVNNETGVISQARPELFFASFSNILTTAYVSRPVSTSLYLSYVGQNISNIHLVKPAYAQAGIGFQSLGPVLELWRAFRNLAYLAFVLAFVVYGFMIMFRMKISPQTVANIQSSIPKLATTLLIITFSYAIAGFIIDLAYLVQELIVNAVFANINPSVTLAKLSIFGIDTPIEIGSNLLGSFAVTPLRGLASFFIGQHGGLMAPLVYMLMAITVGGVVPRIMSVLTPSFGVGWVDGALAAFTNNPLINLIVALVLLIAIFYTFFKVTFALIKAFTITIIHVVFSPLILLGDIFPGSNSFSNWWHTIIANMAVFPATIICFLLSFVFLGPLVFDPTNKFGNILGLSSFLGLKFRGEMSLYGLADLTSNPLLIPPPLGVNFGLLGGGVRADAMMAFVGLGIFMMTPKLIEMIQEALKVPAFKYGTALTEALKFGWKPISAPLGFAGGVYSTAKGEIQKGIVTSAGQQLGFIRQQQAAQNPPIVPTPGAAPAPQQPATPLPTP